jgi:hypothetical protein
MWWFTTEDARLAFLPEEQRNNKYFHLNGIKIKFREPLKDYEIAKEMFGSNSKEKCRIVKKLREVGYLQEPNIYEKKFLGDVMIQIPAHHDETGWWCPIDLLSDEFKIFAFGLPSTDDPIVCPVQKLMTDFARAS